MSFRLPYILSIVLIVLASFGLSFAQDETAKDANPVIYVEANEAQALLKGNPAIQALDVRTKGEFKRGHIDGAIRVNYFSTKFKKKLRALDTSKTYLVHCKSGHRSGRTVKVMKKLGFTNIIHLDGGYDAWKNLPSIKAHL